ncbi:DMT family transporter [Luteimonas sp. FCS-9]|uniref:DMT family transporter n=1 Tax=Luteimonas sp. FCS-9 TaxID=1547516 RepID=UPI00063EBC41|nr:DMT family transporter [Luteimonas sp. FCS-9]KLJ01938.1 EamA-like transporter family protein [Luteimonas sp. FCS-9]
MSAVARAPAAGRAWLGFALATVALWGVWGALSGLTANPAFPETLVYCVWAATMVPPALFVLWRNGWSIDRSPRAIAYGLAIGLLGAGGQMLLFKALASGPAYFIFPIISLSPVITIALSFTLLRERTTRIGAVGVALALVALPLLDLSWGGGGDEGLGWFVLSLLIMAAWGVQAYFMKRANAVVRAESIFFYMAVGALLLLPVAWRMTDWTGPIETGPSGVGLVAGIQVLNAIGALCLVYAFRYGKAIVVAPLTNAGGPLITAALALALAGVVPGPLKLLGLVLALVASVLLALEPERDVPAHSP